MQKICSLPSQGLGFGREAVNKSLIRYTWDRCSARERQGSVEVEGTPVSWGCGSAREGVTEEMTFTQTSEQWTEVSKAKWMKKHPKQRYLVVFKVCFFLFFTNRVFFLCFCKWNFTLTYNAWALVDERVAARVRVGMTCSLQVFTVSPLAKGPSPAPWNLRTQSKNHGARSPLPHFTNGETVWPILRDLSQSCLSVTRIQGTIPKLTVWTASSATLPLLPECPFRWSWGRRGFLLLKIKGIALTHHLYKIVSWHLLSVPWAGKVNLKAIQGGTCIQQTHVLQERRGRRLPGVVKKSSCIGLWGLELEDVGSYGVIRRGGSNS